MSVCSWDVSASFSRCQGVREEEEGGKEGRGAKDEPVERLFESSLIEMMTDESNRSTKDEQTIERTDLSFPRKNQLVSSPKKR